MAQKAVVRLTFVKRNFSVKNLFCISKLFGKAFSIISTSKGKPKTFHGNVNVNNQVKNCLQPLRRHALT